MKSMLPKLSIATLAVMVICSGIASASVDSIEYLAIQDKAVKRYKRLTEQVLAGKGDDAPWDVIDELKATISDPTELQMALANLAARASQEVKAKAAALVSSSVDGHHTNVEGHFCGHSQLQPVVTETIATGLGGSYYDAAQRSIVDPTSENEVGKRAFGTSGIAGSANMRFHVIDVDVGASGRSCSTVGESVSDLQGGMVTCTAAHILTAEKKAYLVNEVFPAATGILRDALRVLPVTTPIVTSSTTCGMHTIPDVMRSPGISNTDFIALLATAPTSGNTVAWAGSCSYSSTDDNRPISGRVNVNPQYLSPPSTGGVSRQTVMTIVHEVLHALGFSGGAFGSVNYGPPGNGSNPFVTETRRGISVKVFAGTIARQKARDYFSCQTLTGAEFENEGGSGTLGSHWEARTHRDDVMCGVVSSEMYLTPITLGALEGYGFYDPDYTKAEMPFLTRGEGCSVHTDTCTAQHDNFPTTSDYCTSGSYACDTQNLGYGTCTSISLGDGCSQYSRSVTCNSDSNSTDVTTGNQINAESRCFPTTTNVGATGFTPGTTTRPARCLTRQCNSNTNVVSFKIGNYSAWIPCPATYSFASPHQIDLSTVTGGLYQGTVLCPDPTVVCAGVISEVAGGPTTSSAPAVPTAAPNQAREPISFPRGPAVGGFEFQLVGDALDSYLTGASAESNRLKLVRALTLDIGRQMGEFRNATYDVGVTLDNAIALSIAANEAWQVYVRLVNQKSLYIDALRRVGSTTYKETFSTNTIAVSGIIFNSNAVSSFLFQNWVRLLLENTFNSTVYDTTAANANSTTWIRETRRLHTAFSSTAIQTDAITQGNVTITGNLKVFNLRVISPSEGLVDTAFLADSNNSCGPGGCIVTVVGVLVAGFFLVAVVLLALFLCCIAPANKKVTRSKRRQDDVRERNATGGYYDAPPTNAANEPNYEGGQQYAEYEETAADGTTYRSRRPTVAPENGAWADDDYYYDRDGAAGGAGQHDYDDGGGEGGAIPFGTVYFN